MEPPHTTPHHTTSPPHSALPHATSDHCMLQTPSFMNPEQLRAQATTGTREEAEGAEERPIPSSGSTRICFALNRRTHTHTHTPTHAHGCGRATRTDEAADAATGSGSRFRSGASFSLVQTWGGPKTDSRLRITVTRLRQVGRGPTDRPCTRKSGRAGCIATSIDVEGCLKLTTLEEDSEEDSKSSRSRVVESLAHQDPARISPDPGSRLSLMRKERLSLMRHSRLLHHQHHQQQHY
eukprot:GHVU01157229.1.p1 GENE.GHVU01157229.1~~GHVU01157229.1.p1  ORF type:complete len:268 (+),score=18.72 GHVU01157229.1:95-805(+)